MVSIKEKTYVDGFLAEDELTAIEASNPEGLSSGEIVEIFTRYGARFSEATLRKYVQLGLLPRSRRVGSKGKHKGSRGIYPAGVVRQINEIKRMMALDYTIEDIRHHFAFVGGEIEELRILLARIIDRLKESLGGEDKGAFTVNGLSQRVKEARESAEILVVKLEELAMRIRELKKLAKEAV
jgi:DNA-binding transcriptional MerR regulator